MSPEQGRQMGVIEKGRISGRFSGPPSISWTRPCSYWDVVVAHLPLALITGTALLLPYLISNDTLPLMKCTFLSVTGYPCPFCGFTRSFWTMARGDWGLAFYNAPLSSVVYGATVLLFLWNVIALVAGVRLISGLSLLMRSRHAGWFVAAMVLLNWIYRLSLGLK